MIIDQLVVPVGQKVTNVTLAWHLSNPLAQRTVLDGKVLKKNR